MKKIFLLKFCDFYKFCFADAFKISNAFGGNENTLSGLGICSRRNFLKN